MFTADVVLPTPPFWFASAIVRGEVWRGDWLVADSKNAPIAEERYAKSAGADTALHRAC
jgi:hypothetical protein